MKFLPGILLATLSLLLVAGCSSPVGSSNAKTVTSGCSATSHYRIGPGDVLDISVWHNDNLNRTVTVLQDGTITFPLVNNAPAAGKTTVQLQNALAKALQKYVSHPRVSVVVQKTQNNTASVLGEVNDPGSYPVSVGHTTVLDMLAKAGGLTAYADKGNVSVMRKKGGDTRQIHFRYYKAVSNDPGSSDFCVRPGDLVMVH